MRAEFNISILTLVLAAFVIVPISLIIHEIVLNRYRRKLLLNRKELLKNSNLSQGQRDMISSACDLVYANRIVFYIISICFLPILFSKPIKKAMSDYVSIIDLPNGMEFAKAASTVTTWSSPIAGLLMSIQKVILIIAFNLFPTEANRARLKTIRAVPMIN